MAKDILTGPQKELFSSNGLIVVENYASTARAFWAKSQALYRTYWLANDGWEMTGLLSFIPRFLTDGLYNKFYAHRHQFKLKLPQDMIPKERILD
jgi:hypothetical protein